MEESPTKSVLNFLGYQNPVRSYFCDSFAMEQRMEKLSKVSARAKNGDQN
jgi:hypothetical protein